MRAYLSGTPECKFGLNDKLVIDKNERGISDAVELDDCRFHQCVRLDEFDATRTISFIPPDGEFELMRSVCFHPLWSSTYRQYRYRSTSNIKLPLRIIPTVTEIGTTQVSYAVTIKTNFNNKLSATNVVLRIPTPLNTTAVDCKVGSGKAKYVPGENVVVWKYVRPLIFVAAALRVRRVPRIQGGQECTLSATAELTSTTHRQVWARPPIDVDFQVLMFTASGLIVRFLKVFEKSNYHSIKWVRYLTKASGSYQIRVSLSECLRNPIHNMVIVLITPGKILLQCSLRIFVYISVVVDQLFLLSKHEPDMEERLRRVGYGTRPSRTYLSYTSHLANTPFIL